MTISHRRSDRSSNWRAALLTNSSDLPPCLPFDTCRSFCPGRHESKQWVERHRRVRGALPREIQASSGWNAPNSLSPFGRPPPLGEPVFVFSRKLKFLPPRSIKRRQFSSQAQSRCDVSTSFLFVLRTMRGTKSGRGSIRSISQHPYKVIRFSSNISFLITIRKKCSR